MRLFPVIALAAAVAAVFPAPPVPAQQASSKSYPDTRMPDFALFPAERLDILKPDNHTPTVMDTLISSAGGPQEYNCPWWSTKCWCSGGAGSSDCNDLVASGKCGSDGIDTGTSADGSGLAGTCSRGDGQSPCPGNTGAC